MADQGKTLTETARVLSYRRPRRELETQILEMMERQVLAGMEAINAYRAFQGADPNYRHHARFELGIWAQYVRLRATFSNDDTNHLTAARMEQEAERLVHQRTALPTAPAKRKALPNRRTGSR